MNPVYEEGRHMTELEIASYLDRGLSNSARDRIEDHLAECIECRENVSEAQKLIATIARPRYLTRITLWGALAAAAALVIVPQVLQRQTSGRVSRDAVVPTTIPAYAPIESADSGTLRFVWGTVPGAASYQVTLSTTDGTTLWSRSLSDTVAILPADVKLTAGMQYVWFTDATLSDGFSVTTGLKEFRAAPIR
jgi:anti-sigma factor RsiW